MKHGIVGWFGSDNLGDEILLHALIDRVAAADPEASFVVFCPDPRRVTEVHGVAAVAMPRLRGSAAARRAANATIAGCDVLFLGPGTVFQERSPNLRWPGTLPLFARIVATARRAGTLVVPVGVGVREGGTALGRRLLRSIGAASHAIGARDRRSADLLSPRATVIGDLAYAVPVPTVEPAGAHRFALSLRPLAPATADRLGAAVSACVRRLNADGWSGAFLPMALGRGARGEDDRDVRLAEPLGLVENPLTRAGNGVRPAGLAAGLDEWLRALGRHDLVVATRLHAAVMAIAVGVPTVAIAYERKVGDSLTDLGLERFVVGPDVDGDALHRTALEAAGSPERFREAAGRIAERGAVASAFVASVLGGVR
jgi:polysaccharide pyruvyl transferase WcaK-like protein